jgi:hypothetical protein
LRYYKDSYPSNVEDFLEAFAVSDVPPFNSKLSCVSKSLPSDGIVAGEECRESGYHNCALNTNLTIFCSEDPVLCDHSNTCTITESLESHAAMENTRIDGVSDFEDTDLKCGLDSTYPECIAEVEEHNHIDAGVTDSKYSKTCTITESLESNAAVENPGIDGVSDFDDTDLKCGLVSTSPECIDKVEERNLINAGVTDSKDTDVECCLGSTSPECIAEVSDHNHHDFFFTIPDDLSYKFIVVDIPVIILESIYKSVSDIPIKIFELISSSLKQLPLYKTFHRLFPVDNNLCNELFAVLKKAFFMCYPFLDSNKTNATVFVTDGPMSKPQQPHMDYNWETALLRGRSEMKLGRGKYLHGNGNIPFTGYMPISPDGSYIYLWSGPGVGRPFHITYGKM